MGRRSVLADPAGGPLHAFAHAIGSGRRDLGLTLAQVVDRSARQFTASALSEWERGVRPPRDEAAVRALADVLELDRQALLDGWSAARSWYRSWGQTSVALPKDFAGDDRTSFVGREPLLGLLLEHWESVSVGGPQTSVLVSGPEGIGKSWLLAEFARRAHRAGAIVLAGRSSPDDTQFRPFVTALTPYVEARPPPELLADLGVTAGALGGVMEVLRRRCQGLLRPVVQDDKWDVRRTVFDGFLALLDAAARRSPVLLVLDDLHWADATSIELLKRIVVTAAPRRLMIVAAYRDGGYEVSSPLNLGLPELRRVEGVHAVPMPALTEDEVVCRVAVPCGGTIDDLTRRLGRLIRRKTNGDALFVHLMVEGLASQGLVQDSKWSPSALDAAIPDGPREAIRERLSRMPESSLQAVRFAAVMGRTFSVPLLRSIPAAVRDGTDLANALKQAQVLGILAPDPSRPGYSSFVHDLFRDVIYEDLRRDFVLTAHHLEVAEAYRRLPSSDSSVFEMAGHYFCALPDSAPRDAVHWNLEAARRAIAGIGFERAMTCLDRALEALALDDSCRPEYGAEIFLRRAESELALAQLPRSKEAAVRAAEEAARCGDARRLARAAVVITQWIDFAYPHPRTVGICLQALEALGDDEPALRVRVMAALAAVKAWAEGDSATADELTGAALTAARQLNDEELLIEVLNTRAAALQGSSRVDEQLALATEALSRAQQIGDLRLQAGAHSNLVRIELERGEPSAISRHLDALDKLRTGERAWFASTIANMFRATLALQRGDFALVEDFAAKMLAEVPEDPTFLNVWGGQIVLLRHEQGRLDEAVEMLQFAAGQNPRLAVYRAALALIAAERSDVVWATRELCDLSQDTFATLLRDPTWTGTLALLAECAARLQATSHARTLYELLLPHAGYITLVSGAVSLGAVDRFLGILRATLGDVAAAQDHLEKAIVLEERIDAAPLVARTRCWYGRVLLATGSRSADAVAHLTAALEVARRLKMSALVAEVERELRDSMLTTAGRDAAPTSQF